MAGLKQNYIDNGVKISKDKVYVGDNISITYDGLLVKSGADSVIAHIGYGEMWDEKAFIEMEPVDGVFKVDIKVSLLKDLNVSFKDSADNWDNNSTQNYSFKVYKKAGVKKTEALKGSENKVTTKKTPVKSSVKATAAKKEKSKSKNVKEAGKKSKE